MYSPIHQTIPRIPLLFLPKTQGVAQLHQDHRLLWQWSWPHPPRSPNQLRPIPSPPGMLGCLPTIKCW